MTNVNFVGHKFTEDFAGNYPTLTVRTRDSIGEPRE
jgi:hypothetical protein